MNSLHQIVLAIRPWSHEQDMDVMTTRITGMSTDGITWGATHVVDIGYGVRELHIAIVCDTSITSIDSLLEELLSMEDLISQVSITLWNST